MKDEFSTFDCCKILGIKRDLLKEYLGRGFIVPYKKISWGEREKTIFNRLSLYRINLVLKLKKAGLSRSSAAAIAMLMGFKATYGTIGMSEEFILNINLEKIKTETDKLIAGFINERGSL